MSCKPARRDPDLGMASGSGGGATIVTPVDSTVLDLLTATALVSDPNSFLSSGTYDNGVWDAVGAHSDALDGYLALFQFEGDNPRLGDWLEALILLFRCDVPTNMAVALFALDSNNAGTGLDGRPVDASETDEGVGVGIRNNAGTLTGIVLAASSGAGSETTFAVVAGAEWGRYSAIPKEVDTTGAAFANSRIRWYSPDDVGPDFFLTMLADRSSTGNTLLNRYSPLTIGLAVYATGAVTAQAMTIDVAVAKLMSTVLS